ncbi:hypothetical protein [Scytonema sp. PRP1]|uniref:hypothetical protein n=1 Tax=Scytonema sp. PRP1 TaxID=3120513 RepID=UPI00300CEF24
MSEEIIYPSIDLFLYDLKDGLGQEQSKIDQNCRLFCQKIYSDLGEKGFRKSMHNSRNIKIQTLMLSSYSIPKLGN